MEITGRKEGEGSEGGSWGKRNRTLRGENINQTRKPCCKGTREKGKNQRWFDSGNGCGKRSGTNRTQGRGKQSLGKHTGNESRETCGGPVPIEKQNGDISHGVNREGLQRSNPLGDITQKSRKMAKEPQRFQSRLPGKSSPLERRNRTLRSTQGGKLPQAEPPAAPTLALSKKFFSGWVTICFQSSTVA